MLDVKPNHTGGSWLTSPLLTCPGPFRRKWVLVLFGSPHLGPAAGRGHTQPSGISPSPGTAQETNHYHSDVPINDKGCHLHPAAAAPRPGPAASGRSSAGGSKRHVPATLPQGARNSASFHSAALCSAESVLPPGRA